MIDLFERPVPGHRKADQVLTCRQRKMGVALDICGQDPPLIPSTHPPERVDDARGMSVDDCLRKWLPDFDACADEPDLQVRCALAAGGTARDGSR